MYAFIQHFAVILDFVCREAINGQNLICSGLVNFGKLPDKSTRIEAYLEL